MLKININKENCDIEQQHHNLEELLQDVRRLDAIRCNLLNQFKEMMLDELQKQIKMPKDMLEKKVDKLMNEELENMQVIMKRADFNE